MRFQWLLFFWGLAQSPLGFASPQGALRFARVWGLSRRLRLAAQPSRQSEADLGLGRHAPQGTSRWPTSSARAFWRRQRQLTGHQKKHGLALRLTRRGKRCDNLAPSDFVLTPKRPSLRSGGLVTALHI